MVAPLPDPPTDHPPTHWLRLHELFPGKRALSTPQVAKLLGVGRSTMYAVARAGFILVGGVRVPAGAKLLGDRRWVWPMSAVAQLLGELEETTTPTPQGVLAGGQRLTRAERKRIALTWLTDEREDEAELPFLLGDRARHSSNGRSR